MISLQAFLSKNLTNTSGKSETHQDLALASKKSRMRVLQTNHNARSHVL